MNYEEFYQQMQALEKNVKDKSLLAQKSIKSISKNSEKGDLKSLSKDLAQIKSVLGELEEITGEMTELTDGFDGVQYMECGEFAEQMIEYCQKLSVDVMGDFPIYEMFPYQIKIDSANQDLYINKKRVQCMRPQSFIKDIKQSRDRLMKAAFNASSFVNELAAAYDVAMLKKYKEHKNVEANYDSNLRDLYNYLVPMQRSRKEYDLQNYAFDLARIYEYEPGELLTKDKRSFTLGPTKDAKKFIRILDSNGNEQLLGTIKFYTVEA